MNRLRVVDYFARAGGFSTGAAIAGLEVVAAANHRKLAVESHERNHPNVRHICQDLNLFDSGNLPDFDVLVASPSCQKTQVRIADGRRRGWKRFVAPFYGSGSGEIARSISRPIGTITTLDRWLVVDGDRGRVLTVDEVREFMSFPRGYYLAGTRRDQIMQLGNAIPPYMAAEVLRQVA